MKKRTLMVIILIAIAIFTIGCKKTDDTLTKSPTEVAELEPTDEVVGDDDKVKEYDDNVRVEILEDRIRITAIEEMNHRYSLRELKWVDEDNFIFLHSKGKEQNAVGTFYKINVKTGDLEKRYEVKGEIWHAAITYNEGIIYSANGFNRLFYVDPQGEETEITQLQSWFQLSPDGRRIVINGVTPDQRKDGPFERYIFDIATKQLKKTTLIPDIDYTFSGLAATWSPDGIHISSQGIEAWDHIRIINSIDNTLVKEIKSPGDQISSLVWSLDGKQLAFLQQSKKYKEYVDLTEFDYWDYLSDKIGIYDVESNAVTYTELRDSLAVRRIKWNPDGKGLLVTTIPLKEADRFLDKGDSKVDYAISYLDLQTKKTTELFKGTAIPEEVSVYKFIAAIPVMKYGDHFIYNYYESPDYKLELKKRNIITNNTDDLLKAQTNMNVFQTSLSKEGKLILNTNEGIIQIDEDFKEEIIYNYQDHSEGGIDGVYGNLSPEETKLVVNVHFQRDHGKKGYIEIIAR